MKKILFVAMAATMFAACTQNEELENMGSNKEMKFNTAVMSTTRATAITTASFNQFTLYAYYGENDATGIINGIDFTKNSETWVASSGKTFYWPGENNVNFWGYSAVESDGQTKSDKITEYNATNKTFKFTVQTASANQEDLLVAEGIQLNSKSNNGTASIAFKHALTKMSFKIIGQETSTDYSYNVTGITINAKSTETYSLSTKAWETTTPVPASVDFTLTAPENAISGTTATNVSDVLMMIPQTGATITVSYTVTAGGYTTESLTKTFTFDAWEKGKNMVYTITLPADAIKPMVVVGEVDNESDWSEGENNGTLTPKTEGE